MLPKNTVGIQIAVFWRFFPSKPANSCISQAVSFQGKAWTSLSGGPWNSLLLGIALMQILPASKCISSSLRLNTGNYHF